MITILNFFSMINKQAKHPAGLPAVQPWWTRATARNRSCPSTLPSTRSRPLPPLFGPLLRRSRPRRWWGPMGKSAPSRSATATSAWATRPRTRRPTRPRSLSRVQSVDDQVIITYLRLLWLLRMLCIWIMGSSWTSPITFLYSVKPNCYCYRLVNWIKLNY